MRSVVTKELIILLRTTLLSLYPLYAAILTALAIFGCEGNDKFYRPNLPEKLCSIGIIDVDFTSSYLSYNPLFFQFTHDSSRNIRSISFEKSYQAEYPEELNDSLREFSFYISSSKGPMFNFQSNRPVQNLFRFRLPDDIVFSTGEKYYLTAKEKDNPEISAEVIVPKPPSVPDLISVEKEPVILPGPLEGWGYQMDKLKSVVIRFSFKKDIDQKQYFALIMDGIHRWNDYIPERVLAYLDYSVRECNSPGFFARWHGIYVSHPSLPITISEDREGAAPVSAYFIEGSNIPGDKCEITITTQFHGPWSNCRSDALDNSDEESYHSIRIKLFSVPEALYQFEKSLYTYERTKKDPFSEPVLYEGNIKNGNGVFAICRSTELIVNFSPPY